MMKIKKFMILVFVVSGISMLIWPDLYRQKVSGQSLPSFFFYVLVPFFVLGYSYLCVVMLDYCTISRYRWFFTLLGAIGILDASVIYLFPEYVTMGFAKGHLWRMLTIVGIFFLFVWCVLFFIQSIFIIKRDIHEK